MRLGRRIRRAARLAAAIALLSASAWPLVAAAQDLEGDPDANVVLATKPPRIKPPASLPSGWTSKDMEPDARDYVFWRFEKHIGETYSSKGGGVDALHDPWLRYGTMKEWDRFAEQRLQAEREAAESNRTGFRGDTGRMQFAGREFGYVRWHREPEDPKDESGYYYYAGGGFEYYSDLGDDSEIWIKAWYSGNNAEEMAQMESECEEIVNGLVFDFEPWPESEDKVTGTTAPGTKPGGLPWKTAAAGAAAVATAAAAVAAAAASATGRKTKLSPTDHVGYVLELSTQRLTVARGRPASLTARAWRVLASGAVEPAADAAITLRTPAGVSAAPAQGTMQLTASLTQDGDLKPASALAVDVTAAKGGTRASVTLIGEDESTLELSLQPASRTALKPNGKDVAHVVAALHLSLADQADPALDVEAARQSIAFSTTTSAEWLDTGEPVDAPLGKAMPIAASPPDPDHPGTPPESVMVRATAQLGTRKLAGSLAVPLERPPSIDCRPDVVEFSAGTGETAEVLTWIDAPGEVEWSFTSRWRENDRPLATIESSQESPSSATFTLTEDSARLPDIGRAEEASTLVLVGSGEGWDPLERYVKVIVTREGLFIDPTGRDPDGTFHVEAKGEAKVTEVDLRVYVKDAEGVIAYDPELSEQVEFAPGGEPGTPGHTALGFDDFTVRSAGQRPSNVPSATYSLAMGRKLPTGPEPVRAALDARVPGFDKPEFAKTVPLTLLGVDTSPYSAEWKLEQQRCLEIIAEFAPYDLQQRLRDLVYEKGPLMGAEGLYEMRKRIWSISENALRKEAQDWLDKAWTYEQIESVLDWISWCGDIAFAVASGRIVGTAAGIGLGLLKPALVDAMTAWVDGKDMWWWAGSQVKGLIMVAEGQLTDPDFLQKVSGASKAKIWAVFIAYTFVKNWATDPEHRLSEAMINTVRMLRDQALISFLRTACGASPVPTTKATPAAGGTIPKPPTPTRPKGPAPEFVPKPPRTPGTSGKSAKKPPAPGSVSKAPADKKAKPEPRPKNKPPKAGDPEVRAKEHADRIRAGARKEGGKTYADEATTKDLMRDPDAARKLKASDPEAYKAYDNTRAAWRADHDAQLGKTVADRLGVPPDKVKVRDVGTVGGVDRDVRVTVEVPDPRTPGKTMEIEVPKERWQGDSHRIFSDQTGGPTDPVEASRWAKDHGQVTTDGYHAEAAADMADQGWHTGPDGKRVRVQVEPRVDAVKRGEGTLIDPDGLGRTYETKVGESYHEGHRGDAFKQAAKAVHDLEGCRDGYRDQGFGVKDPPAEIARGIDIIKQVEAGTMKPAAADAALQKAGLGKLPDFMEKVSGQFGALGHARRS